CPVCPPRSAPDAMPAGTCATSGPSPAPWHRRPPSSPPTRSPRCPHAA
ncbi:MAG: hypothetical protein AVDCRST_MAG52-3092, partial [uncultured Blastococcus sp.]